MTNWVVIFDDTAGMLAHRKKYKAEHLQYAKDNADKILVGGGLRAVPDAPFEGGMWIVRAKTHDEVVELVLNDPYFNADHRRFKIYCWDRIVDGPVTI